VLRGAGWIDHGGGFGGLPESAGLGASRVSHAYLSFVSRLSHAFLTLVSRLRQVGWIMEEGLVSFQKVRDWGPLECQRHICEVQGTLC